jgi:hypothetical protein
MRPTLGECEVTKSGREVAVLMELDVFLKDWRLLFVYDERAHVGSTVGKVTQHVCGQGQDYLGLSVPSNLEVDRSRKSLTSKLVRNRWKMKALF